MSVLDKLSKVSFNVASVVNENLQQKISATVDLANLFIQRSHEAEKMFLSLVPQQNKILDDLNNKIDYYEFYSEKNYQGDNLDFVGYRRTVVTNLLNRFVLAVNTTYGVNFVLRNKDKTVERFLKTGIDMDVVYQELLDYLGGETFVQRKRNEMIKLFLRPLLTRTLDVSKNGLERYTNVTVKKNIVLLNNFCVSRFSDHLDSQSIMNLKYLQDYVNEVMGESLMLTKTIVNFVTMYEAPPNSQVGVVSIKVFKNGGTKIVFRSEADLNEFVSPLINYLKNQEDKNFG